MHFTNSRVGHFYLKIKEILSDLYQKDPLLAYPMSGMIMAYLEKSEKFLIFLIIRYMR